LMIIYRREMSVISGVFLNHWVTFLRVHDAWDSFGNIRKHWMLIEERRNHFDKSLKEFRWSQKVFRWSPEEFWSSGELTEG
jgi:hypothetical protein